MDVNNPLNMVLIGIDPYPYLYHIQMISDSLMSFDIFDYPYCFYTSPLTSPPTFIPGFFPRLLHLEQLVAARQLSFQPSKLLFGHV